MAFSELMNDDVVDSGANSQSEKVKDDAAAVASKLS
jgi:hypothetical protein